MFKKNIYIYIRQLKKKSIRTEQTPHQNLHMPNNYMKKCSTSFVVRKLQIKTMKYY